jgi:glycerol kinase
MKFAAIDQGTTSTRVLVADQHGCLNIVHTCSHRQHYPQSGWVEHDPEELITNIQACADAAGLVDAFAIDNQGESCVAWHAKTKKALSPVLVWQDSRTIEDIKRLKKQGLEQDVKSRSGLPLDTYFSASKMAWMINNIPAVEDAYRAGQLRLGTTDAFFLDRLTGHFKSDVSTASRTSLMNINTLQWDPVLCDIFGVPMECLPEICSTTGDFGKLKTAAGHIPVTASIVDQQAALFGFGCRQPGDVKITFGTGAFAQVITGPELNTHLNSPLLPTVAWQLGQEPPVYALDGGVYTASASLNWARSLGLFSSFSQINSFNSPPMIEQGLVFVPALSGLGCPYWESEARGAWQGLSLSNDAFSLVQSIIEGIAYRGLEIVQSMEEIGPISSAVVIDGGMTKNPYFTQFLANVLQRDVKPARFSELTAYGAARLAAIGFGENLDDYSDYQLITPLANYQHYLPRFKQACSMSSNWAAIQSNR